MSRTAFIGIVGRPNVGKSTLLNGLVGEKVAIVSSKPQTTRNRITGILTKGEDQYVFMDTPGLHKAKTKLGDFMVKAAGDTIGSVDACILVVEAEPKISPLERGIIEKLKESEIPALLVINKTDKSNGEKVGQTIQLYASLFDFDSVIPASAEKGKNVDIVLAECERYLTESVHFFDDDIATDQSERTIACEVIREKILRLTNDEIPHGTAVTIEKFTEEGNLISIYATIICERDSHKGIIIGHNGDMLKKIGSYAREDLEEFFGCKIFLELWVKVKENWRDNERNLNDFGYVSDKD